MTSISITLRTVYAIALALIAGQAITLLLFGQPTICECGMIKLWEGVVASEGNSQHVTDWYTYSHIVHGLIFYGLLAWMLPAVPLRVRLLLALGIEVAWEVLENTPIVIDHYRQQALAAGYSGDSILNSLMDTAWMITGFLFAWRMHTWASIAAIIVLELFVLYMIRDNLTLNVVNLVYPSTSISEWQLQGGIK